jgi:two-component system OmpR family sensor kinase
MPAFSRLPIRLRMALWFAALLVALVGATGIFLLSAIDDVVQEQVDTALRLRASRVEREITTGDDDLLDPQDVQAGLLELAPLEEFSSPGIYVQVRDATGTVIAASANLPRGELPVTRQLIEAALENREGFETVPVGSEEVRVLAWPVDATGPVVGVVVVGQSLRLIEVTRQGVQRLITIAAGVAMLAALGSAWWLTTRALRPISDVTRVVRSIAATGQFEQRVDRPPADDEVGQLVVTFNEMLARLERTLDAQREFLADASHELRGPLMVIRGNLDLLRLGLPEEERRTSVREASEEVDRMSRLAADLLFLAADADEVVEQEPVRFDQVVAGVWERARHVDDGAHDIELIGVEPLTVVGDRGRLEQLVWNLVENAIRYTPPGGTVELELMRHAREAVLRVSDTGGGIPVEHLPRIFERFYRVDRARSRSNGGTGLGLAIVKSIVEAHGGRAEVSSKESLGTVFTVWLPAQLTTGDVKSSVAPSRPSDPVMTAPGPPSNLRRALSSEAAPGGGRSGA